MGRRVPIYTNHDEIYQVDTCQPLMRATQAGEIRLETLLHGHYPGRVLPKNTLPGLKTVGFWDAEEPQIWGWTGIRTKALNWPFPNGVLSILPLTDEITR
jgi:hypothetical protein